MSRSPRPARPRLSVEPLEDRSVPAAGALDPTFGTGGFAAGSFGATNAGVDVVVQPDGKVVTSGTVLVSTPYAHFEYRLVRHNPDGSLDAGFGTGGVVSTDMSGTAQAGSSRLALQPDGKIVVGGLVNLYEKKAKDYRLAFGFARFLPNGRLDTTFDGDGIATVQAAAGSSNESLPTQLALQPDGKIVAAGRTSGSGVVDVAVVRLTTAGKLDTTFDGDGRAIVDLGRSENPTGLAIQPDGKIVLAGDHYPVTGQTGDTDVFVARLTPAGRLDTTFGRDPDGNGVRDGWVLTDFVSGGVSQPNSAKAMVLQGDRIVVGGRAAGAMTLTRYTAAGDLDPTFGDDRDGDGTPDGVAVPFTNGYYLNDLAVDPLGRLVFVGGTPSSDGGDQDYLVGRFTADGRLDPSFGVGGVTRTDPSGTLHERHGAVAIGPDGKIVAAGARNEADGKLTITLARYLGDDI